jgi:hypothetical protein
VALVADADAVIRRGVTESEAPVLRQLSPGAPPRWLVAGTGTFVIPVHFPHPTAGLVEADGERFRYAFVR